MLNTATNLLSTVIESAEGVQQGGSVGPLLFTLSIHHFVMSLYEVRPQALLLGRWYMSVNLKNVREDLQLIASICMHQKICVSFSLLVRAGLSV
jgi:hypothetical protein